MSDAADAFAVVKTLLLLPQLVDVEEMNYLESYSKPIHYFMLGVGSFIISYCILYERMSGRPGDQLQHTLYFLFKLM